MSAPGFERASPGLSIYALLWYVLFWGCGQGCKKCDRVCFAWASRQPTALIKPLLCGHVDHCVVLCNMLQPLCAHTYIACAGHRVRVQRGRAADHPRGRVGGRRRALDHRAAAAHRRAAVQARSSPAAALRCWPLPSILTMGHGKLNVTWRCDNNVSELLRRSLFECCHVRTGTHCQMTNAWVRWELLAEQLHAELASQGITAVHFHDVVAWGSEGLPKACMETAQPGQQCMAACCAL